MTTPVAEQETAVAVEEGSAASESTLDQRIAESIAKHSAGLGVTLDDAATEVEESAPAEAEKAEATPETKTEATTETETKKEEARVFTAEELSDPKTFYRLDKKGWADLEQQHPALAAGFKAVQAEQTRREQAVAAREKALTSREETGTQTPPGETTRSAPVKVSGVAIVDALNDPDRVESGEALGMLAQHPAFGKIIDNYLESKGIRVDALREASNDNTFSAAIQLATYGDASAGIDPMESLRDTKVQEEMMKETSQVVKNLLQHPEPQVRAVGLQMAATNAELRLSRSSASTPAPVVTAPDPIEEATKKARAAAQAKPVAKATVLKSAAAEGDRRSSPTQKSSLDERIAASAQKHLENITSARGRL